MSEVPDERRAVFLHPTLGLGGAERLILQASAALRKAGWSTVMLTAEYDPARAFPESDGEDIRVVPSLVPPAIGGRFKAWCAYLRMRAAVGRLRAMEPPELVVVDLIPHVVPFLKRLLPGVPVLVYCHFPDQLMAPAGRAWYRWYRQVFDGLERRGFEAADAILTNSHFTRENLLATYPSLKGSTVDVVWPGVASPQLSHPPCVEGRDAILALSRIHPAKNLELALEVLASAHIPEDARLIIAGGWDPGDRFCRNEKKRLMELAHTLGVGGRVDWRFNPSDAEMEMLWQRSRVLIYPPLEEHFGLVPLEAMARGVPVVAVNAGGPKEIVLDGITGCLREPGAAAMGAAVARLWSDAHLWASCSLASRDRVSESFGLARFEQRFQDVASWLAHSGPRTRRAS